ncbi:MAG: dienelactone hydrolase family protein [Acidobacteria bacterium]|nr:dienelactone hydrolase family protein [Acidobacteriota bacterium]
MNARRKVRLAQSASHAVSIPCGDADLPGELDAAEGVTGVVLFAHGSGSSRHSPRNRYVAQTLQDDRLATLLMDLLTAQEEQTDLRTAELRFDISLLVERVIAAADWLGTYPLTQNLPVGVFGASTGAAAALAAAAERPHVITAVVSRGGRPDLAGDALKRVTAPTLLIVGGNDSPVIHLNRIALEQLRCEKKLEIVPGATHLFEEPGALERVSELASDWFVTHLRLAGKKES